MFDDTARAELEESLGYERYLLKACSQAVRDSQGVCGPLTIIISDEGPRQICMSIADGFGDTGVEMTHRISPLVFAAAYKLLDMVVEWIIKENGLSCPNPFTQKLSLIKNSTSLVYPDLIDTDPGLRQKILKIYERALPFRNAITHGRWGKNAGGDLHFNFSRGVQHFAESFKLETVLAFAEAMALLGDLLVASSVDQCKLNAMFWLFDKLDLLHGMPPFGIVRPRYMRIVRETHRNAGVPLLIDMKPIRSAVQFQAGKAPVTFDLRVEAESATGVEVWEIGFADIPPGDILHLDERWDAFLVSQ